MRKIRERICRLHRDIVYSVGTQIGIVLAVTCILFVLFAVVNQRAIILYSDQYENEIDQYNKILELKKGLALGDSLFYDYIKTNDRALLEEYQVQAERAAEYLAYLDRAVTAEDGAYLLVGMEQSFASYRETYESAARLHGENNYEYYNYLTYGQKINKYLKKYADELLQDVLQEEVRASYELQQRQKISVWMNFGAAMLITVLIAGFCIYIYRAVTLPLNELAEKAEEMSAGNLNVHVRVSSVENNVTTTSRAFNAMAASVRDNVENERKKVEYEKLLNEARFMALQTQTNPHFLFNTLNSISRTITFGRYEQAQMMLGSLAALMRYNLADADVPVFLETEIRITNEYVKIQKMRFGDRINVEFRYDEDLVSHVLIPRFTLQPLVENSIVHGIEPKNNGGRMVLDVRRMNGFTRIRICDDGVGIRKQVLRDLQKGLLEKKSKRIGIWNTYQRMELFTKDPSSFRVLSKVGMGTMVILKVPDIREEVS